MDLCKKKMSGLTNKYVEEIGKKVLGRIFLGTFPCDIHPEVKDKKIFCLVFNLSKHDTKGSHFVAIFASEKKIIYFDPYGNTLTNPFIKTFINNNKKNRKLVINNKCIQSCASIFCGFFCLGFLISQKYDVSLKSFISFFDKTKLNVNDDKIIEFIQSYI